MAVLLTRGRAPALNNARPNGSTAKRGIGAYHDPFEKRNSETAVFDLVVLCEATPPG